MVCFCFSGWARRGSAAAGCRCCRGGAQNLQFECGCILHASEMCWDVVKLDLSFKTRIRLPPNSPGLLRSGSDKVFGRFSIVAGNHPTLKRIARQGCAWSCKNATKSAKESTKIGTPFCSAYLDCCERVRPVALIWDRFSEKVISGRAKTHRALKFPFETESLLVIWPNGRVENAYF